MALAKVQESLFWDYINERHAVYLRRQAGNPKPWTKDPILRDYKFTNVFREFDTGTRWLRTHFTEPHRGDSLDLLAFNCAWYRMFNWVGTGERLGWQTQWDPIYARHLLSAALSRGEQVFTGAHIVRSAFGVPKIDATVDVCSELWAHRFDIVKVARESRSLGCTFDRLQHFDYIGPFMAHEMVIDYRHTPLLEDATDINLWSNAGPGAMRGLERLGLPFRPPAEALKSMIFLLEQSRTGVLGAHVTPLELHQIEFCLCELDKYARILCGEGKPRSRYPGAA